MQMLPRKKNELSDLLEPIDLSEEETYICLTDHSTEVFKDLVTEYAHKEKFLKHNLSVTNKLLLHGASGNGKTTAAKFIARRAKMPMIQVRQEQVVSSYIGETGKFIANVFDGINQSCILFWDEFDAISYSRSLNVSRQAASEEYNKALNVLLVRMEKMDENVLFIAATNRLDCIDEAVIRRFDLIHEMPPPTDDDKMRFMGRMFKYYKMPTDEVDTEILALRSFSDIKNAIKRKCRSEILKTIYNK